MRDWLAIRAGATPDGVAIAAAGDVQTAVSYEELNERVEVVAGRLAAESVGVDDRLAVCLETRAAYITLVHAALRLGAVLVPLEATLTADELTDRLRRVDPALVVCSADTEPAIQRATEAPVVTVDAPSAGSRCLTDVQPEPFDLPAWELEDPLVVMFTSGSTGRPKGVILTQQNVLASATASAFRLGVQPDDCWHICLPMAHMGGLAPVYRSVLYGTTVAVQRGFQAERTLQVLRDANATAISVVPTMLERMLDTGSFPPLRFVLVGGAACPPSLLKRAFDRDIPVAPTYGLTEAASQVATARPQTARRYPESVGPPVMFAEVRVVDDSGVVCDRGERGELIVNGPMVSPGYLDETTPIGQQSGGLRTGDRGHRDDAGRIYIHGRLDDTIVTGGENVDPTEVRDVIESFADVAACAVVGLSDDTWGERVAALVVPTANTTISIESLQARSREQLADYKAPRTIAVVDALPRTASGTIDRTAVREHLRTHRAPDDDAPSDGTAGLRSENEE